MMYRAEAWPAEAGANFPGFQKKCQINICRVTLMDREANERGVVKEKKNSRRVGQTVFMWLRRV